MKIGDIEYTRKVRVVTDTATESENTQVSFAVGVKLRALLTRVSVHPAGASAVTNAQGVYMENGQDLAEDLSIGQLQLDNRALPLWTHDDALATNGMGSVVSFESLWWKILMPGIQIIAVTSVLASISVEVLLHYRFAELTPDEVIEIAAQRSQG